MTGQYIIDLFLEGLLLCGHLIGNMIASGIFCPGTNAGFWFLSINKGNFLINQQFMALGIIIRQRLKGSQDFGKAKASAQAVVSGSVLHAG